MREVAFTALPRGRNYGAERLMEPIPPPRPSCRGFNSVLPGFGKLGSAVSLMAEDRTVISLSFLSFTVTITYVTHSDYIYRFAASNDTQSDYISTECPSPILTHMFNGPRELSLKSPSVSISWTHHHFLTPADCNMQSEVSLQRGGRAPSRFHLGPGGSPSAPQSAYFLASILHWGYRRVVYHSTILEVKLTTPFPIEERDYRDLNNLLYH